MESVETQHDPRCSYWVEGICVCQQIAELEEKAEWLGQKTESFTDFRTRYFGSAASSFMGTMTVGYSSTEYPFATTTAVDPSWSPKYAAGISEVDKRTIELAEAKAAARAEIYARIDEDRVREESARLWREKFKIYRDKGGF